MPKIEDAYYQDNGRWLKASFTELTSATRRAELRACDLRDQPDGLKVLGVRNHPITPHFYERVGVRLPLGGSGGESTIHMNVCGILLKFISGYRKVDIGYYETPWSKKDKGFEELVRPRNYSWNAGKDASIGVVYGRTYIPDILGRSKAVALLDSQPFIAIEIVHTHFLDLETFRTVLHVTRNIPLVIGFYFCAAAPYLNQEKAPETENGPARLRLNYYIADGSFWQRNERIEEIEATLSPDRPDPYYHYVLEKLIADRCVRRDAATH